VDGVSLRRVGLVHPDAVRLTEEVQREYVVRYGGPDATSMAARSFEPPEGAFFVGYAAGRPVAMGGWRRRPDVVALGRGRSAEVKRMYVAADVRRLGLGRLVLAHLEDTARAAGADVMVLETGLAQPEAIGLYQSSGYVAVPSFGHYRDSELNRCFGKPL
jgi:GNAT superfamily N-acetyltransferase